MPNAFCLSAFFSFWLMVIFPLFRSASHQLSPHSHLFFAVFARRFGAFSLAFLTAGGFNGGKVADIMWRCQTKKKIQTECADQFRVEIGLSIYRGV